jgi:hypothetical protein
MMTENSTSGTHPTPTIPVSWGELIDKITILEIKADHVVAVPARSNVLKELELISGAADAAILSDSQLAGRKRDLKAVNEALWKVEDRIRAKERVGLFDQEFIDLARSVYKLNDQRADIKKKINALMSSEIVEEKSYPG